MGNIKEISFVINILQNQIENKEGAETCPLKSL